MPEPRHSPVERFLGLLAMVGACSIWGLGPLWIRELLVYLPPTSVCLFRLLVGTATLLPLMLALDGPRRALMFRQKGTWLGGLTFTLNMSCYAAALSYIRPAEVNLVFQISIVASALLGLWLYHERIPPRRWLAFAIVLTGVTLVIFARDDHAAAPVAWNLRLIGMTLGLLAGIGGSLGQAAVRDVANVGLAIPAQVPMMLCAALLMAAASGLHVAWRRPPDAHAVTTIVILGVMASGVAAVLSAYAIRRISLAQAGVTGSMQPVVTILVTALLGELLPPLGLVGGALVVGGVIWSALLEREVQAPTPSPPRPAR